MVHGIGMSAGARGARCSPVRLLRLPWLWLSVAIATIVVVVTTAACGRGSTPERGRVALSVGYAAAAERNDEVIAVLAGEGLVRTSPDGHLEPLLAESWTIADAGTTVLINLQQDVSFHDGSRMTAADVKASLDQVRSDPRRPMLGDIESIETPGPHSVLIRLARPSAQLVLFELGVRIEKRTGEGLTVGTGPFRVAARGGNEETTLLANPHYHRGAPLIDEVHLKEYPTLRTAWAAMMRSEIDLLYDVPIVSREFVDADSSVRVSALESPYAFALVFNTREPPFDDPRLRVALSHAIDREAIIEDAFRGHASVASGIWREHWVYGGVDRRYRHDPKRANRLLRELGLERPSSVDATGEFPSRLRFECLVGVNQAQHERTALLLQRQLRRVGVEMEIVAKPFEEVEYEIGTGPDSWGAVLLPVNSARNLTRLYTYWHSSQPIAVSGFTGADDALEALRLSVTDADVEVAARRVQRILFEEAPAVFLAAAEDARAVSRRFVVPDEPGRDIVETLWQWRVATGTTGN